MGDLLTTMRLWHPARCRGAAVGIVLAQLQPMPVGMACTSGRLDVHRHRMRQELRQMIGAADLSASKVARNAAAVVT
jgi:hypothetical protein